MLLLLRMWPVPLILFSVTLPIDWAIAAAAAAFVPLGITLMPFTPQFMLIMLGLGSIGVGDVIAKLLLSCGCDDASWMQPNWWLPPLWLIWFRWCCELLLLESNSFSPISCGWARTHGHTHTHQLACGLVGVWAKWFDFSCVFALGRLPRIFAQSIRISWNLLVELHHTHVKCNLLNRPEIHCFRVLRTCLGLRVHR